MDRISRPQLTVSGALAAGALAGSPRLLRDALATPARAGVSPYGPLGAPDANGLMLPRMRLRRRTRRRLLRRRAPLTARLLAVAVMPSGRRLTAVRRIRVTR